MLGKVFGARSKRTNQAQQRLLLTEREATIFPLAQLHLVNKHFIIDVINFLLFILRRVLDFLSAPSQ